VQNTGSFTTPELFANAEYTLLATGPGGVTNNKIQISVCSRDIYFLTKGSETLTLPWFLDNVSFYDKNNNFLRKLILSNDEINEKIFYYIDGRCEVHEVTGKVRTGIWSLDGKKFNSINDVIEISEKKFSYRKEIIQTDGSIEYAVTTLIRK